MEKMMYLENVSAICALLILHSCTPLLLAVRAATDPQDVGALEVIYRSLNAPSQLLGWKSSGGDPCGESWKGVSCEGQSVSAIQVSGLGLNGTMGYLLSNLLSLKTLDVSNNKLRDTIPFQLPPNLTYLNIAGNNFSGNLPYSLSSMVYLVYLNVSHNSLSTSVEDIFTNLQGLSDLDLSFNNFSGSLPNSFSSLSNLSTLFLQNNQLTGHVDLLASLPLDSLNIANNNFSGWIPPQFKSISNLIIGGNNFDNGPAPPPPPYKPLPPQGTYKNQSHPFESQGLSPPSPHPADQKMGSSKTRIVGIATGSVLASLSLTAAIVFCLWRCNNLKEKYTRRNSSESLPISNFPTVRAPTREIHEQRSTSVAPISNLKPPPSDKVTSTRMQEDNGTGKRLKAPITATSYSAATLQVAANSFSQDFLVGEGSLGRVYRAEFPNGKVMAIKKIDSAAVALQEESFLDAILNMARLRHANIVTLQGYCLEHGHHLLVYDYVTNGSLHDMLHCTEDSGKALTWNARVKIATGIAKALEYLHEVCEPPIVHRNLKSTNILLDEEMSPHLSDCGLAALTTYTERQISTQIVGSFGYSPPEFAFSGRYTVKSDVYSFGVVMLELMTGRMPLDGTRACSEKSLVRWATPQLHDIDALAKMVDPALNGIYPAKSLSGFADIIALCVQPEPEFRPPMSEVVQALVRLMHRASTVKRHSSDELAFSFKTQEYESFDHLSS